MDNGVIAITKMDQMFKLKKSCWYDSQIKVQSLVNICSETQLANSTMPLYI